MLEFRLGQENLLTKVMESLKDLVYEANFECNSTGLSMQGMDPDGHALASLLLRSKGFKSYCCHRPFSIGIDTDDLAQMLQCAGNDDVVTIKRDDRTHCATFVFDKDNRTSEFEMKLMDTVEELQIVEPKSDAIFQMPSTEFARICEYLSNIGDIGVISVTKEGLKFSTKGDTGTANIVCRQNKCVDKPEEATIIKMESPVSLTYTLRYMNLFTNATPLASQVTVRLASDMPIVVEYKIADIGYLRFYLAPFLTEDEETSSHNTKLVVTKKPQEKKRKTKPKFIKPKIEMVQAQPSKRSKTSESDEYSTTSSSLRGDKNTNSLVAKSSQFHEICLEKLQKEKLSQEAIEREDFKILVTNTDHLTGPALLAAELLKEKIAKKYGV